MNHPKRSKAALARNPTPDELRKFRAAYGLSQSAAAKLAMSTLRSWQNWESGDRRMHPAIWRWAQSAAFEISNPHIGKQRWQS